MSFPITLSPSPVQEAFAGIQWDPQLSKLESLSDPDLHLLRAGEDKPIEYILADQHDAQAYAHVLLKVIDQTTMRSGSGSSNNDSSSCLSSPSQQPLRRVSALTLDQSPLPDDEALQYLYDDSMGVVLHYAISKLSQVIQELKSTSAAAAAAVASSPTQRKSATTSRRPTRRPKVTLASIFYPSGILVDDWRPLWRMLSGGRLSDPYAQRGAAYCLACILLEGCGSESSYLQDYWGSSSSPTATASSSQAGAAAVQPSLNPILESFVTWMTSRLASAARPSDSSSLSIMTPSLTVLLSSRSARRVFDAAGGVGYLSRHLRVVSRRRPSSRASPSMSRNSSSNNLLFGSSGGGMSRQYSNSNLNGSRHHQRSLSSGGGGAAGGSPSTTTSFANGTTTTNGGSGTTLMNGLPSPIRRGSTSSSGSGGASVQQLYELTYSLWLLSYDCYSGDTAATDDSYETKRLRKHFLRDGAVPNLCQLVLAAPREKVVRLALSTLCNLAVQPSTSSSTTSTTSDASSPLPPPPPPPASTTTGEVGYDAFRREIHACGLLEPLERMLQENETNQTKKKWSADPDVQHDLTQLVHVLRDTAQHMTRWDVYAAEVESSYLQWGMVHTEKFFRANAMRMEGKDGKFSIVRTLIKLAASEDEEVAAIACYDIGEFARHYPAGRSLAKRLGARDVVLSLIEHEHPELQHQALVSVSKMLVLNWKAVG